MSEAPPQPTATQPPTVPVWSLALRFVLELAALAGLALLGLAYHPHALAVVLAVVLPVAGGVAWGVLGVRDDPSREAVPRMAVSGQVRLAVELGVFVGALAGFAIRLDPWVALGFGLLVGLQACAPLARLRWLLAQPGPRA